MSGEFNQSEKIRFFFIGFIVYGAVEAIVAFVLFREPSLYYLLSTGVWILLGIASRLLYELLSFAIRKITKISAKEVSLCFAYIILAPSFFINLVLLIRFVPGQIQTLSNICLVFLYLGVFFSSLYLLTIVLSVLSKERFQRKTLIPFWLASALIIVFNSILLYPKLLSDSGLLRVVVFFGVNVMLPWGIFIFSVLLFRFRLVPVTALAYIFLFCGAIYLPGFISRPPGIRKIDDRPNVILIVMDSARAKQFNLYGYPLNTTPRINEFAKEAVVFDNAYSNSSWTVPSHASLFTGMIPSLTNVNFVGEEADEIIGLDPEFITLAEILKENGYRTGCFSSNPNIKKEFGFTQGFDDVQNSIPELPEVGLLFAPLLLSRLSISEGMTEWLARKIPTSGYISADHFIVKARKWARNNSAKPFFLFMNLMELHEGRKHSIFSRDDQFVVSPKRNPRTGDFVADNATITKANALYDYEMRKVDSSFGRIIDFLKAEGVFDSSLICLTSDHGQLLGEHGEWLHGNWLYQEIIHIPLLVKYSENRNGGERDVNPVQQIDIFAEILKELNVAGPVGIQGQPFDDISRPLVIESVSIPSVVRKWPARYPESNVALISKVRPGFKLIEDSNGKIEIYNIAVDRGEMKNIDDPKIRESLIAEIKEYYASMPPGLRGKKKRIRFDSLGYINNKI